MRAVEKGQGDLGGNPAAQCPSATSGARRGTDGQQPAALLVPVHGWSQLPSTDNTQEQERPWTPTSRHSRKGVPREDPEEFTSPPTLTSVKHSSPQTWHLAAPGWLLLICCQAA